MSSGTSCQRLAGNVKPWWGRGGDDKEGDDGDEDDEDETSEHTPVGQQQTFSFLRAWKWRRRFRSTPEMRLCWSPLLLSPVIQGCSSAWAALYRFSGSTTIRLLMNSLAVWWRCGRGVKCVV